MIWYAHGGRAPSAKCPNDLEMYELALDMRMLPDTLRQLRKKNPRDYNKLVLVNEGRKLGVKQIALSNKVTAMYPIQL